MKTYPKKIVMLLLACTPVLRAADSATTSTAIPLSGIGAKATADYKGDAIGITATATGATLRSGFQKLDADASADGLWLHSTEPGGEGKLRIIATGVGRGPVPMSFPLVGSISLRDGLVFFSRKGITEEYSTSMDGVRQDFVLPEKPPGLGELELNLGLSGAAAKQAADGAMIILAESKRELTYSRLHVTDATGRELNACLEVTAADVLRIRIDDQVAVYPVRVDPTFSDADWYSMGQSPGISNRGAVYALAVIGTDLYVGGSFASAGGVTVNNIAKWNGSVWSAMGTGTDSSVYALAASGTDLYAGGEFTLAGGAVAYRIAKWNGTAWSGLGVGMDDSIYALATSGTDLYAAGSFTTAGGASASRIAKWNGSTWTALGTGVNQTVYALGVSGTNLYAAGDNVTTAGGVAVNRVAKWNGISWSALGSGITSGILVRALAVSGTEVYVGGYFSAGGANVVKWNGSAWSDLGSLGHDVYALSVSGGNLYAGGSFGGGHVAKWNGTSWDGVGSGVYGNIYALATVGTDVYAGGDSSTISKWNGTIWSALGSAPNGEVKSLAVSGTDIYIGGYFQLAGGVSANNVAKWNGTTWSPLGTGLDSRVNALAVIGANLYAGGSFTTAGGVSATRITKWDGITWTAVGAGMNDEVLALAVSGSDLYAGGRFTIAGLVVANRIAKWDGSTWSALGTGITFSPSSGYTPSVSALAVNGGDLYAGGFFDTAGGVVANSIAKWNGITWSPLGVGVPNSVSVLAVSGANVYAGGYTGRDDYPIQKWNGSSWSSLPTLGTYNYINAFAVSGCDLYVGGSFSSAGGVSASCIAKWNGNAWSPLGSGVSGQVNSLLVTGQELYVGGQFGIAGDKVSSNVARAHIGLPPVPAPEIAVEQPPGSDLTDGVATKSFGSVTLTGSSSLDFTIRNNGTANLTGLAVTKSGTHLGDFIVTAPGASILAPGASITFTISFEPTASGVRSAAIHIASNDADENPFDIQLTGTGTLLPVPEIAIEQPVGSDLTDGAATRDFGSVTLVDTISLDFTIRNLGAASLTSLAVTKNGTHPGDFIVSALGASTLAAGASTTFTVNFEPTALGARTAAIHIVSNDANENPFDIQLTGTGTPPPAPEIVVEKPAGTGLIDGTAVANLGTVLVGKTGTPVSFTIRNTGDLDLTGLAIAKNGSHAGDFTVIAPGASLLAPGASTTFTVTFKPTAGGTRSAAIHIASNDADENPFDINLTGIATVPAPEIVVEQPVGSSLVDGTAKKSFGTVKVGKTGTAQTFTIKNTGTANLTGLAITKDGAQKTDFIVGVLAKTTLAPGASTTFKVTFKPTAKGTRNAAIHIKSNDATENPFDIKLAGMGAAP